MLVLEPALVRLSHHSAEETVVLGDKRRVLAHSRYNCRFKRNLTGNSQLKWSVVVYLLITMFI